MRMKTRNMTLWVSGILILIVYFVNLGVNDIWNPNEGFYADAIREMLKHGNFLDFFFNHHHRFNKPPVTYWSIYISTVLFGLNEFAIRLPMIIFAIGTVYYTYKAGKRIYGQEAGLWAAAATALSPLFLSNTRYATPEIPLAFFVTFTLYLFIKAYQEKKFIHWLAFYVAWGFTVLTKGYPYFVLIGGIMAVFLLVEHDFKLLPLIKNLKKYHVFWGLPLAIVIGMSWVAYSYLKFGDNFLRILSMETVERAFVYQSNFFEELFFFPSVVLWGFLPYSFVFFYALVRYMRNYPLIKQHLFGLAWFWVFLVVFTIAKFKLPTYFIQANGGMALLTGYFLSQWKPLSRFQKGFANVCFILPGVLAVIISVAVVYIFKLSPVYYAVSLLPLIILLWVWKKELFLLGKEEQTTPVWQYSKLFPFAGLLILFFMLLGPVLGKVEHYRLYDQIGKAAQQTVPDGNVPLIVENRFLHNLPYYAARKERGDMDLVDLIDYYQTNPQMLALVKQKDVQYFPSAKIVWSGKVYTRDSEAVFMSFIQKHAEIINGDDSNFEQLSLIWVDHNQPQEMAKN
jgi:4-amino-4-deoxy-L-arabinose transferase-like glycosyltransferase